MIPEQYLLYPYRMKFIVTGGMGFIGSHFVDLLLRDNQEVLLIDKMTYAANPLNLSEEVQNEANFQKIDIADSISLNACIENFGSVDCIVNFAAESHVDRSIKDSTPFAESNIKGTMNLLEVLRNGGAKKMIQVSTDEVYGSLNTGSWDENSNLDPRSPYSASKAAADMLINAWGRTHGIPYVIVRPTNNYGVGQYVEKLIPKSVKYLELGRPIDIHDRGEPRRTWLHVADTVRAVATIIDAGVINETYNISGNTELSNRVVVQKILAKYFNNGEDFETTWSDYVIDSQRVGQDVRYSIDDTKLKSLGWSATAEFDTELSKVVQYYKDNFVW